MTDPVDTQPVRPPWSAEGRYPDADELHTWLLEQPEEVRIEYLHRMLDFVRQGSTCRLAEHDQYPVQIHHQSLALLRELDRSARYRMAWLSARRRAQQAGTALDLYADQPVPVLVLDETRETVTWDSPTSDPAADLRTAGHNIDLDSHTRLVESARRQHRDVTPSWPCHVPAVPPSLVHTDGPCPETPAPGATS